MQVIKTKITIKELQFAAQKSFGNFVKAVVDIKKGIMAIGGNLHADEEALLLKDGSDQYDLWGINIYPGNSADEFIEFDSMINIRPVQNNRSRSVGNSEIRDKIKEAVKKLVKYE